MKSKWYVLVAIVFAIGMLLCSCQFAKADSGYNEITFGQETNSKFVGSYILFRTNNGVEWTEYGEWKNDIELFFNHTCVKLTYSPYGEFQASDGYHWVSTQNFWGEDCLKLQKNK